MADVKGIKETLELLEGVRLLAQDTKAVLKDGKVNLADLPVLMTVFGQFGALSAAVQGLDQVMPELKDLTTDEANQLVAKALEIVAVVQGA